jgi:hypothetical protein
MIDRDDLLARVDLPGLLDALSGPGQRGRWRCPDVEHPDAHPSVTVRVNEQGVQTWRCWSGGHRGTAIDAVIAAHRVDVGGAIRWLTDHYGAWPAVVHPPPPPARPVGQPDRAVGDYLHRAELLLWTPAGSAQRAWLAARGLGEEVLHLNRVGADPGRRFLPRPARGFPAGWPAVVYPALEPAGDPVYFQARYLDPPQGRSKYDNPAGRFASNPRVTWTRTVGDPAPGVLVVCEGAPDALVAAQAGYRAVGVLGSGFPDVGVVEAITTAHTGENVPFTMAVCFDGDDAGRSGAAKLCGLLADRGVPHLDVRPPEGCDVTSWAQTDPGWTAAIDHLGSPPPVVVPAASNPAAAPVLEASLSLRLPGPG